MDIANENMYADAPARLATVGYFLANGKILLGFRKKVSNHLGLHIYGGIGGKTMAGESRDDCLKREIKEEISTKIIRWKFVGAVKYLFPDASKSQEVSIAIISEWEGEPVGSDVIRPEWFPLDHLPAQMWPDAKYTLPLVLAYKPGREFSGVFIYNEQGEIADYRLNQLPYPKKLI